MKVASVFFLGSVALTASANNNNNNNNITSHSFYSKLESYIQQNRHLQTTDLCDGIGLLFPTPTDCKCSGNLLTSFTLSCQSRQVECYNGLCAQPGIATTFDSLQSVRVKTCLANVTQRNQSLDDFCLTVQLCDTGLCNCQAEYGGENCTSCNICNDNTTFLPGLQLDCRNVNPEVVMETCQGWQFDASSLLSSSSNGEMNATAFFPNLNGICSQIEQASQNNVQCTCLRRGSGSDFAIRCQTPNAICINNQSECGHINATATLDHGGNNIATVQTCFDNMSQHVCTNLTFCNNTLCKCQMEINNQTCSNCQVCQKGNGIQFDCTNIVPNLWVDQCQNVTRLSSFDYVPKVDHNTSNGSSSGGSGSGTGSGTGSTGSCVASTSGAAMLLLVGMFAMQNF